MPTVSAFRRHVTHVTVKFDDGDHVFLFPRNATLTQLADFIGALGAQHISKPISIDVAVASRSRQSMWPDTDYWATQPFEHIPNLGRTSTSCAHSTH